MTEQKKKQEEEEEEEARRISNWRCEQVIQANCWNSCKLALEIWFHFGRWRKLRCGEWKEEEEEEEEWSECECK